MYIRGLKKFWFSYDDQLVLFLFLSLNFLANYIYSDLFSMYDDDLMYIRTMLGGYDNWFESAVESLVGYVQGRPLAYLATHSIFFVSGSFGGLKLGYLIGLVFITINAYLLYRVLINMIGPFAAIFAGLLYVVFPTDNSKAIVLYAAFNHLNVMILLFSVLLYRNKRIVLSYFLSSACFLIYEPAYLLFLLAPIFTKEKFDFRRFVFHGFACVFTVVILLCVRKMFGDPRINETFSSVGEIVNRVLLALVVGPKTVLITLFERPIEAIQRINPLTVMPFIIFMGIFRTIGLSIGLGQKKIDIDAKTILTVILGGFVGVLLAYALCFRDDYWPPIMSVGRISGYHNTASVAFACLLAGLIGLLLHILPRFREAIVTFSAIYIGLLLMFGVEIQRIDYVAHKFQQKEFFDEVIDTSNEWNEETVVLVDISGWDSGLPSTPGMPLWWTVNFAPLMLQHFVFMPAEWKSDNRYPRVYGILETFEVESIGDTTVIKTPPYLGPDWWPKISGDNFVLFHFKNGRMQRTFKELNFGGVKMCPMPIKTDESVKLEKTDFYDRMFSLKTKWDTIKRARNYPR